MLLNRMPGFLLLGALLAMLPVLAQSEELAPFTSDGCSAFPDGWPYPRGYKRLTADELEQVQEMRP